LLIALAFVMLTLAANAQADADLVFAISDLRMQDSAVNPQSAIENRKSAGVAITYTYDAAGRLIQADYGSKRIIYTYDSAGNLTRREVTTGRAPLYLPLVLKQ
jgi:YD repeat-containing protein